jgi:hypothetical protein
VYKKCRMEEKKAWEKYEMETNKTKTQWGTECRATEKLEAYKRTEATKKETEEEYHLTEGFVLLSCEHIPLAVGSISCSISEMFIQVVQL